MSSDGDPFQRVLAALAADPASPFGAPGAQVDVLLRRDGPFSLVRRVRIRTPARTIHAYVKVLKPRGEGQEGTALADRMLAREYRATAALHDLLRQDAEIGAVRPIAWLPDHRALVTEEVPGRPLGELLGKAGGATDELQAIGRRVGAWARLYQGIGHQAGAVDLADRRAYIDDRLKLLEGRAIGAAGRQAVLARVDALVLEIGAGTVPAVPIHADLTPMNIIVGDDGRVVVLDFTMAKSGTIHHDLAHVYLHLELMALRHPRRQAIFRAVRDAMLRGYGGSLTPGDPLFRLMLLQHGVCHVAMLAERRVPLLDAAYRWFLRRRLAACLELAGRQPLQVA